LSIEVEKRGWIGVDWDGTLVEWTEWVAPDHVGPLVPRMVERVKLWLSEGREVRIFTARMSASAEVADVCRRMIERVCEETFGTVLPITNVKDLEMLELWDDRCVQVVPNTGRTVAEEYEARAAALTAGGAP
jgi:hypothetical protein